MPITITKDPIKSNNVPGTEKIARKPAVNTSVHSSPTPVRASGGGNPTVGCKSHNWLAIRGTKKRAIRAVIKPVKHKTRPVIRAEATYDSWFIIGYIN